MAYASIDQMRAFIADVYGGSWAKRVEDMPDNQVMAIYYSIVETGRPDAKSKKRSDRPRKERQRYDPRERFNDESDADYYDRLHHEL